MSHNDERETGMTIATWEWHTRTHPAPVVDVSVLPLEDLWAALDGVDDVFGQGDGSAPVVSRVGE